MKALLTAAAILATALPAYAAAPVNHEVHCLMLSNLFARSASDAQGKEAAAQTRLFYLGRVSAKVSPAQLLPAMTAEAKAIDIAHAGPDMNACHATLASAAQAVEVAGKSAQSAIAVAKPAAK